MSQFNFDQIIVRRGFDGYKWNRYPQDILPMWVADSDFKSPEQVINALAQRVQHGVFGYTHPENPAFAQAAARWMQARFSWQANPAWVEFSPGVCAALSLCVTAFSNPGDDVVKLTPVYPPFFATVSNNGRNPVSSSLLLNNNNYEVDFEDLENKLAQPRARLLFLCNPHNPTGRVLPVPNFYAWANFALNIMLLLFPMKFTATMFTPGMSIFPFLPFPASLPK